MQGGCLLGSAGACPGALTHSPRPAGLAGPHRPRGDPDQGLEREGPGWDPGLKPPPHPTPGSLVLPAAVGSASWSPGREGPTETPETSPVLCGRGAGDCPSGRPAPSPGQATTAEGRSAASRLAHLWGCCARGPGPGPICPQPRPRRPRCRRSERRRKSCSAHPGTARCPSPSRGLPGGREGQRSGGGGGFLPGAGQSHPGPDTGGHWVPADRPSARWPPPQGCTFSGDRGATGQPRASRKLSPRPPGGETCRLAGDRALGDTYRGASWCSWGQRTRLAPRGRPAPAQRTR